MAETIGIIVGRFQVPELHFGHRSLLDAVSSSVNHTVVILGTSVLPCSYRDPLPFTARKKMISSYLNSYPHTILQLRDCNNDVVWNDYLDTIIDSVGDSEDTKIIFCGRNGISDCYTGKYPIINLSNSDLDAELQSTKHTSITINGLVTINTTMLKSCMYNVDISGTTIRNNIDLPDDPTGSLLNNFNRGVIFATQRRFPHVINTVDVAVSYSVASSIKKGPPLTFRLFGRKKQETLYRFVGGFCDPNSLCIEDDAIRELKEETGLLVEKEDLTLIGVFKVDDWRYRKEQDKIATTFFQCNLSSNYNHYKTLPKIEVADDLHEAKWFAPDEITEEMLVPEHRELYRALIKYHG